ncbi:hypothetical protein C8J57DRAFT_1623701 [Mycena rebaudengoi]|nr:hypothetical protein C8J57DRAFT_1623701 [Mycena rebaudengoi]
MNTMGLANRLSDAVLNTWQQKLALPFLYMYPMLSDDSHVQELASQLQADASLGAYVREIHTSVGDDDGLDSVMECVDYEPIFSSTTRLTRLVGHGGVRTDWDAFTALGETAGATLIQFTGYSILGADFMDCSPTVFCSFTSLRYLTWESNIEFSAAVLDSVSDALPNLEALQMISCSLFPVLAKFKLPNIYRVVLPPQVTNCVPFFLRHGSKITDVAMHLPTIDTTSIFALCPNMTHLTLNLTDEDSNYLPSFALDTCDMSYSAIHGSLAKLVIHKTKQYLQQERTGGWKRFFDRTDFSHFPALRELQTPLCKWPTTEAGHEIAASPWIKYAAMLVQHGIRLTDEAGVGWRPRLGTGIHYKAPQS